MRIDNNLITVINSFTPNNVWMYTEFKDEDGLSYMAYKVQNFITGVMKLKNGKEVDIVLAAFLASWIIDYTILYYYCPTDEDFTIEDRDQLENEILVFDKKIFFDFDVLKHDPKFQGFSVIDVAKYIANGGDIPVCLEDVIDMPNSK